MPVDCDRGDPDADGDGSGQCWLTDNSAASGCNSDVDGGHTILTSPVMDATGTSAPVVLAPDGATNAGVDAGLIFPPGDPSTIGDFVWLDSDRDGRQDAGETGLAGVTVELRQGTTVVESATTGVDGFYTFTDVESGAYSLRFSAPPGYSLTAFDVGSNDAIDSDPLGFGSSGSVNVSLDGVTDLTLDAGFVVDLRISGRIWDDVNGDGIQAPGASAEPGVGGVVVNLRDGADALLATDTTGSTGSYRFDDLGPGDYRIEVVPPTGRSFTLQDQGSDSRDSDVDPTGTSELISLSIPANTSEDIDAGLLVLPS